MGAAPLLGRALRPLGQEHLCPRRPDRRPGRGWHSEGEAKQAHVKRDLVVDGLSSALWPWPTYLHLAQLWIFSMSSCGWLAAPAGLHSLSGKLIQQDNAL